MREEDAAAIAKRLGNLPRAASSDIVRFRFGSGGHGGGSGEEDMPKPAKKVCEAPGVATFLHRQWLTLRTAASALPCL